MDRNILSAVAAKQVYKYIMYIDISLTLSTWYFDIKFWIKDSRCLSDLCRIRMLPWRRPVSHLTATFKYPSPLPETARSLSMRRQGTAWFDYSRHRPAVVQKSRGRLWFWRALPCRRPVLVRSLPDCLMTSSSFKNAYRCNGRPATL